MKINNGLGLKEVVELARKYQKNKGGIPLYEKSKMMKVFVMGALFVGGQSAYAKDSVYIPSIEFSCLLENGMEVKIYHLPQKASYVLRIKEKQNIFLEIEKDVVTLLRSTYPILRGSVNLVVLNFDDFSRSVQVYSAFNDKENYDYVSLGSDEDFDHFDETLSLECSLIEKSLPEAIYHETIGSPKKKLWVNKFWKIDAVFLRHIMDIQDKAGLW